jgi:hypothetical protein
MSKKYGIEDTGNMVNGVARRFSLAIEKEMEVMSSEDGSPLGEINQISAGVATAALAIIGCHMGFKIGSSKASYLELIDSTWDWIAKHHEAEDEVKDILNKMRESK